MNRIVKIRYKLIFFVKRQIKKIGSVIYNIRNKKYLIKVSVIINHVEVKFDSKTVIISEIDFYFGIPCYQLVERNIILNQKIITENFNELKRIVNSNRLKFDEYRNFNENLNRYSQQIDNFVKDPVHKEILKFEATFYDDIILLGCVELFNKKDFLNYKYFSIDYCLSFGCAFEFGSCKLYFVRINDNCARLISASSGGRYENFTKLENRNNSDYVELHYNIKVETYNKIIQIIELCLKYGYPTEKNKKIIMLDGCGKGIEDYRNKNSFKWICYSKEYLNDALFD
jgi:hypothetical protein